jgi:hypothetical protein
MQIPRAWNINGLAMLSSGKSRSVCPENPTGGKGAGGMAEPMPDGPARELGRGWKCRPYIIVQPGQTDVLADIEGPGVIQSMWFAGSVGRDFIVRIYWDDEKSPSVEVPLPDFFALPWMSAPAANPFNGPLVQINSLPVAVNPNRGLNCFWEMPFRRRCRITLQNQHPKESRVMYYQVNFSLEEIPEQAAYFHAQFRRMNPVAYMQPYTILDGVSGRGHYVGTSMGWGINNNNWWGEGEIKFFMDGDKEFPTICGTGTEDYFGGAYDWDVDGKYVTYTTPFLGMHQVVAPDGHYKSQHRHAMYRWHIADPIRFERDLRVTIQALGWRSEGRFLPGQHDICSVAYWYQTLPAAPFPPFPTRDQLEIT